LGVDIRWRGFHYDFDAVTENGDGREKDENGEDVGANGVGDLPFRFDENDDCSANNTDALDHVSQHVNHGRSDIHIFCRFFSLLFSRDIFVVLGEKLVS